MFTINIYLRFALIALNLVGGIILAFVYGFWYAFPFILIGVALLAGYILLGTVQSTAQLVQESRFEEAEQRLGLTIKPDWLYKTNRAFYYLIQGNLAMQRKDQDKAEEWLIKAQKVELPSDNEKAMVELQLANIQASKNKWTAAKNHFNTLKKLKVTEPMLKEQIKQFEKALSNRGSMKQMGGKSQGGMVQRGGKRRRPKMR
ncbi:MAG: hypothetical protein AB8G15_07665 [Saprospiraceae bacterium]